MYCQKCGKELKSDYSKFCPNCGTKIISVDALSGSEATKVNDFINLKKAMSIISIICGSFAAFIFLYANATTLQGHNDNIVSETFGNWWFEDGGIYIVIALVIIAIIAGVIAACTKSNKD